MTDRTKSYLLHKGKVYKEDDLPDDHPAHAGLPFTMSPTSLYFFIDKKLVDITYRGIYISKHSSYEIDWSSETKFEYKNAHRGANLEIKGKSIFIDTPAHEYEKARGKWLLDGVALDSAPKKIEAAEELLAKTKAFVVAEIVAAQKLHKELLKKSKAK